MNRTPLKDTRLEQPERHKCFRGERVNIKNILILLDYDPPKTLVFFFLNKTT